MSEAYNIAASKCGLPTYEDAEKTAEMYRAEPRTFIAENEKETYMFVTFASTERHAREKEFYESCMTRLRAFYPGMPEKYYRMEAAHLAFLFQTGDEETLRQEVALLRLLDEPAVVEEFAKAPAVEEEEPSADVPTGGSTQ